MKISSKLTYRALAATSLSIFAGSLAAAQDNILVYGNSIIDTDTVPYFSDLVEESGAPKPNIFTWIFGDKDTSDYVLNDGLISSLLAAGDTWDAMIIEGGTYETTSALGFDPADFQANMLDLANTYFAHSPQGLFVGHETGADHPTSTVVYPSRFPDAATWLGLTQGAYETARVDIDTAHPSNPPVRIAPQGTVFAETAGYPIILFQTDLHHHRTSGKLLSAMLYYQTIYGGKIADLGVDFTSSTPLVTRLNADGINEARWNRLVGFADRSLPAAQRLYPGSDDDFQLRFRVNTGVPHNLEVVTATAGDVLGVLAFSPLGSADSFPAAIYLEVLPTATLPATVGSQTWHLRRSQSRLFATLPDLNGGIINSTVPSGLAGASYLMQSISRMNSNLPQFLYAVSDAKVVNIQ